MRNLIVVAVAVLFLSGCVVNTPAPAPQVTAVASAPVGELWCSSSTTENGVTRDLGISFIRDYGNRFTVLNGEGKVTIVSPNLPYVKANSAIGYDKLGLMYSKGSSKYAGFYGVFRTAGPGQQSITFDCR
ncbi:adhesin [Kosakonia phage Kc283]|uniref:Adhesin n=1 Tax=Kosakonia phage Kc283 TaxID=2863195 RepID=A0AAE7WFC4_9CAUD|nr:lipoprotein [Kosakonia phage Kc283]QYN79828.1 adhesin [Kosakonia phage Kc283]